MAEINRESHRYEVTGIVPNPQANNRAIASSLDGNHLYISGTDGIAIYGRDAASGAVNYLQTLSIPTTTVFKALALSPDDQNLYGVVYSQLAAFSRNPADGSLTLEQVFEDGIGGIDGISSASDLAVAPDGTALYVAGQDDSAVAAFSRNLGSGLLTFVEAEFNGVAGVAGLESPTAVAVSPDDQNVYLVGQQSHSVVVFDRSSGNAQLEFRNHILPPNSVLRFPTDVTVSSDGSHVYASGINVAIFAREPSTGDLNFLGVSQDSVDGALGLILPESLDFSPSGQFLAVAGASSLAVFERNPASGFLAFLEANFEGDSGITDLGPPHGLAFSEDGQDIYHGGSESVVVFSDRGYVFVNGLESGDSSAWTATVP